MTSGHNVQQVSPFLSFPFSPPRIRIFASLLEQRVPATLSQCQCRRLAAVARRAGDARALLSILRHVYDRHCTAKRDELSTPSSKLNTRGSMGMHCVTQPPLAPGPSSTLWGEIQSAGCEELCRAGPGAGAMEGGGSALQNEVSLESRPQRPTRSSPPPNCLTVLCMHRTVRLARTWYSRLETRVRTSFIEKCPSKA